MGLVTNVSVLGRSAIGDNGQMNIGNCLLIWVASIGLLVSMCCAPAVCGEEEGSAHNRMMTLMKSLIREQGDQSPQLKKLLESQPGSSVTTKFFFDRVLANQEDGLVILRFHATQQLGYVYVVWSRAREPQRLEILEGLFRVGAGTSRGERNPQDASEIAVTRKAQVLFPCAPRSPVIASVHVEGNPIEPFRSHGDLWLSTWADDDCMYSAWGDGFGVVQVAKRIAKGVHLTDCGIVKLKGTLPKLEVEEICFDAPTADTTANDKPSSLLFIDGRLYGHFHSPLGDAWIGYLAYSDDYGRTWKRVGFYREWEKAPEGASPWCRDRNSPFRCLFFINMGKNYELNTDGYVYGLGIGMEWSWRGGVYLARVPKKEILDYQAYQYFTGMKDGQPGWSRCQFDGVPLPGVSVPDQGSAMYHPGVKRYLFLTRCELYDAPTPWGPWTYAGSWLTEKVPEQWHGGYQPGIISKDAGPDYFWFTISGQNRKPNITYNLILGKIVMKLRKGNDRTGGH